MGRADAKVCVNWNKIFAKKDFDVWYMVTITDWPNQGELGFVDFFLVCDKKVEPSLTNILAISLYFFFVMAHKVSFLHATFKKKMGEAL